MAGRDSKPRISVCIPAYNRAGVLPELVNSVLAQGRDDYEIVVCEDASGERAAIRAVMKRFQENHADRIRYYENDTNLGYDGNLRRLVQVSRGDYCLFMGNDDLLAPGALAEVAAAVDKYPDVGVVLRSYATFEGTADNIVQEFRYFEQESFFPAGPETITAFFRRSVVISGLVIHRDAALRHATDRFDGTLLYQLYLVGNILAEMNGVSLPKILALYRTGGVPDFGHSEAEKGRFVPQQQTPESSLAFVRGMLEIARDIETRRGVPVYKDIFCDIGNYSYPILSIQAGRSSRVFLKYCFGLARMGFWRSGLFYVYMLALLILGVRGSDRLIGFIKRKLGRTPLMGRIYRGKSA